jgi:type I restriction enzyme S subunit
MEKLKNTPSLRFPNFEENWNVGKMIDYSTFYNGKAFKQEELLDNGKYPVLRVGNLFTNNNWYFSNLELEENKYIEQNDLIYAWSATFGPRIWKGNKVIYHYHIWKVICKTEKVNKWFFYQILDNATAKMKANSSNGFALLHITKGTIENWSINIPSLSEQTKIASFLTAVDDKLTALKQKKTFLEQYKKGVMQKIFSQELRFKDDNGNEYPDWEEKKLGDCLDYIQPTKYLVSSTEYDNSYTTPVLTAGKTFILGYTNETDGIFENNLPVIIFDDFTTATQFVDFPFKAKSSAMKILVSKDGINIRFMYEAMQIMKYEVGGHERHWISKFAPLEISIPSTEEQTKIANFLSSIDDKINHCGVQIEKMEVWKKGLLHQMFI